MSKRLADKEPLPRKTQAAPVDSDGVKAADRQAVEPNQALATSVNASAGHDFGRASVYSPEARSGAGESGPAPTGLARQLASAAFQGPPQPFPFRERIESALGQPVPPVAHLDRPAAETCDAVGAEAFTAAGHVAFARGAPSLETAAHEAVHLLQQADAPALTDAVSAPNDAFEQQADRLAGEVVAGGRSGGPALSPTVAAGPAAIQRQTAVVEERDKEKKLPSDLLAERQNEYAQTFYEAHDTAPAVPKGHTFEGGSTKPVELEGKDVGEAGYGARLGVAGSQKAQEELAKGEYGVRAPAIEPYTETLENAIAKTAKWVQEKEKDRAGSEYKGGITAIVTGIGKDPDWVTKSKGKSVAQGAAQLAMLERHKYEQWNCVGSYNSWAPLANLAAASRADLVESANMLGFNLLKEADVVRFVQGVEQGLDMANELVQAKLVGPGGGVSWAGRHETTGAVGPGPTLGGSAITPLFDDLAHAFRKVEVTQLGIYQNMLDAREKVLKSDKANKEAEVDQINGVIQFWTSMASLAEGKFGSAMKLAKGETAGKIEGRVGNVLAKRRADKQYDEAAKLAQEGKGAAQQRLYLDRAEQAREFASEAPESMEISVGEVVGKLVEWHYEEQLSELKSQIVSLEKQIGAVDATQDLAKAEARIKDYADARKALSDIAKQIKNTALAERERNYLDAGESLDRYARAHASQLKHEGKGSLAPKSDKQEIYSTLMVIVGKIRAYLLLSDKARETFAYDDFVSKALQLDAERREPWKAAELAAAAGDGFWVPPRLPQTSKKENERVWEKIDGVYAHVFKDFDKARIQFEDAVTKMTTLFQSMKGVKSKEGDSPENQY